MYIKQSACLWQSLGNITFTSLNFEDSSSPVMKKGIYAVFNAVFDMLEIWPKLCQCDDLFKKRLVNVQGYSWEWIEYSGYFM